MIKELLLVNSFNLEDLIRSYQSFFMALIPGVFIIAVLIEYLDRQEPFALVKRAMISILILSSVSFFYYKSIDASMRAADAVLKSQKQVNPLILDMFWQKLYLSQLEKEGKENRRKQGVASFFKYHLFDSFVNDGFTKVIFFFVKICFLILKVVYSLVYYLGYGLIGIPCLLYLFPTMGNVLRGAIISFLWCLIVPHILVFIISMIGHEINQGYIQGEIIGGSMAGTALLFIMALFIAFAPLVTMMLLSGSGMAQAGGIIAAVGANWVLNLPRQMANQVANMATGGTLGPKMRLAATVAQWPFQLGKMALGVKGTNPLGTQASLGNQKKLNANQQITTHKGGNYHANSIPGHSKSYRRDQASHVGHDSNRNHLSNHHNTNSTKRKRPQKH